MGTIPLLCASISLMFNINLRTTINYFRTTFYGSYNFSINYPAEATFKVFITLLTTVQYACQHEIHPAATEYFIVLVYYNIVYYCLRISIDLFIDQRDTYFFIPLFFCYFLLYSGTIFIQLHHSLLIQDNPMQIVIFETSLMDRNV